MINRQFSPILRLPPEIMADIFSACITVPSGAASYAHRWTPKPEAIMPLVLGMVCRTWRELAWSIPQLWRTIPISLNDPDHPSPNFEVFESWIARSGRCPLFIDVSYDEDIGCPDSEDYIDDNGDPYEISLFRLLARTSERWYSANFDLHSCAYSILQCVSGRLPLLTSLYINIAESDCLPEPGTTFYDRPWDMFNSAPQLRSVKVDGYEPDMFSFNWDQLNEVSLNPVQADDCLEILSKCPGLSRCTFGKIPPVDSEEFPSGPQEPILASELVFLSLQVDEDRLQSGSDTFAYILDGLTTPVLRELQIKASTMITLPPSFNLHSLLSRSTCSLQRLVLHGLLCYTKALFNCLDGISSIVELEMRECFANNDTVIRLLDQSDFSSASRTFLPNLRSLTLIELRGDCIDFRNMVKVFSARRSGAVGTSSVKLQSATIQLRPEPFDVPTDVVEHLRQLCAEGMQISIRAKDTIIFQG